MLDSESLIARISLSSSSHFIFFSAKTMRVESVCLSVCLSVGRSVGLPESHQSVPRNFNRIFQIHKRFRN